jgi:TolB protein
MKLPLLCAGILFSANHLFAQDAPKLTISKSDKLSIAITGLSAADAKVLEADLQRSGLFSIAPAGSAAFTAGGSASGDALAGSVVDHAGKSVLAKTFGGSSRGRIHAFADEIVETLTGNRGIAATKIAFVATRTGKKEIYTCDADGSNLVQLTHDNAISVGPSLSSDGRRLLYTGYQSGYADVYAIDLSSGSRQRIIKYPGTNTGAAFSPDSSRIAVTLSKDGNPELYVTGSGGGGARRLTRTSGSESSPSWSPDGSEIVYSSDDRGGSQLFRISSGGGTGRPVPTGRSYCTEPNWSPDGKKVAFNTRGGGGFEVAITDLGTETTRTVADGNDPIWGADSRHLLFASGGSLILLDVPTGQRTTLVSGLGKLSEPAWSR